MNHRDRRATLAARDASLAARAAGLAARAAGRLEYTTDSLENIAEKDPEIAEVVDNKSFLRYFDSLIFCCNTCNWWKRQRENATPDASAWQCQECFDEA